MRAMTNPTNTTNTTTTAAADVFDGQSVIAVSFEDDRSAYKALSILKELEAQHRLRVQEAVVVARGETARSSRRTGSNRPTCRPRRAGACSGF